MLNFDEFLSNLEEGFGLPFKHKAINTTKKVVRKAIGTDQKRSETIAHHVDQFKVHHRIANDKAASDSQKQKSRLQMQIHKSQIKSYMEDD